MFKNEKAFWKMYRSWLPFAVANAIFGQLFERFILMGYTIYMNHIEDHIFSIFVDIIIGPMGGIFLVSLFRRNKL